MRAGRVLPPPPGVPTGRGPAVDRHVPHLLQAGPADGALDERPHLIRVATPDLEVQEAGVDREEAQSRLADAIFFIPFQVLLDELFQFPLAVDHGPGAEDADERIPDPIIVRDPVRRHRMRTTREEILKLPRGWLFPSRFLRCSFGASHRSPRSTRRTARSEEHTSAL